MTNVVLFLPRCVPLPRLGGASKRANYIILVLLQALAAPRSHQGWQVASAQPKRSTMHQNEDEGSRRRRPQRNTAAYFHFVSEKWMAQRLSQFRSNSGPIPGECGPFFKKRQFRSRHPHKTRLSQFRSNSGPIPGECGPFFKNGSFAPDILTKPGGPISVQFRSNSGPFWSIFRISTAWLCEPLSAPQMSVQSPSQRRSQVALAMVATMFASQLTLRDLEGRVVRFKEKVRVPEGRLSREASTSHPDCVCVAETEATVREHTIIARLARCVPRLALKGAWGAFVGTIEAVADQASACCLDFTVCFQRSKVDHPATLTEPRGSEFCCQMRGRGRGRKRSVFADLIVGDPSERANKHLRFDEPTAADVERSEVRNAAAKELEVVGLGRKSTCP